MIKFVPVTTVTDIKRLAEIAGMIWREAFKDILSPRQIDYMVEKFQSFAPLKTAIERNGYEYFFIYDGKEIAGYTGLQETDGKLFLSKLYISKQYRGRKIASGAFLFIEETAKKRNLKNIWLTVNRFNRHAIDVYKAKGFVKTRNQKTDIGSGFIMDDYVFEKEII